MQKRSSIKRKGVNKSPSPETNDLVIGPDFPEKNPAAVALGRLGGLKGGKARAEKLSAKKRTFIAKKAAEARWSQKQ